MASIGEKVISILTGNLNSGRSYLITAITKGQKLLQGDFSGSQEALLITITFLQKIGYNWNLVFFKNWLGQIPTLPICSIGHRPSWARELVLHKKIDGSAKCSSKMSLCSKLDGAARAGPD